MKVTQFETTKDFFLRPYELKPTGGKMSGVDVIEVAEIPNERAFEGFGVAVTGSSCYNLNLMSADERENFLNDIYSESGLGLSVCRMSVGSSDYSAELYTYDDGDSDPDLKNFSVGRDDDYIVPMIKEVLKIRPDMYVFASPWSPPGWMKTGGVLLPSKDDVTVTQMLINALSQVNIRITDHLIICDDDYISFNQSANLKYLFE